MKNTASPHRCNYFYCRCKEFLLIPPSSRSLSYLLRRYNFKLPKLCRIELLHFVNITIKGTVLRDGSGWSGSFDKEREARRFLEKSARPPGTIMWEPFKNSAPPHSCWQLESWLPTAHTAPSAAFFTTYSCWQWRKFRSCCQWRSELFKHRIFILRV
jgi:hypothetical protein